MIGQGVECGLDSRLVSIGLDIDPGTGMGQDQGFDCIDGYVVKGCGLIVF